ncbi:MAG: class I SAM-dependent methyltransferase [Thermoanaerobaculaceae bacterium]
MKVFPCPIDRLGLLPLLGDLPEGFFTEEFSQACEELDAFIGECLHALLGELELFSFEGSLAELGFGQETAHGRELLRWLVECASLYGFVEVNGGLVRVKVKPPIPELGASFQERVAKVPGAAPALAVQRLAKERFLPVLRGETTGEAALFSLESLDLWFDYFSNNNVHYAASNNLAALALARVVPPGAKILELGGGAGSAAQAALLALNLAAKAPSRYVFTEPQPAFLRRGSRILRQHAPANCQTEVRGYDINVPPSHQGFAERDFDAIYAVNVLHLATDLFATLGHLRSLLKPGGAVVLGELIRPTPASPVHLELPFLLLDSYVKAGEKDGLRQRPGFLALSQWEQAFQQAGFAGISLLPQEITACLERYPGFYAAALVARV